MGSHRLPKWSDTMLCHNCSFYICLCIDRTKYKVGLDNRQNCISTRSHRHKCSKLDLMSDILRCRSYRFKLNYTTHKWNK